MAMSIDDRILEFAQQPSSLFPQKEKPSYQEGDIVKVQITGIKEYGAFCVTMDGKSYSGLIHISHIAFPKPHPDEIEEYVQVGQVLEVKVKNVKEDGKIEFCALHLNLKPNNPSFAVLDEVRDQLIDQPAKEDREFDLIIEHLTKELGNVSEEGKGRIKKIVEEFGVFRFTIAMMEILPTFEKDISVRFSKELEKKMRDGL